MSPRRGLFDEMLKLLFSGHAVQSILLLRKKGLHHGLLPMLDVILEQPMGERFVMLALAKTDQRIEEGKPVSPAYLFAALLWHEVLVAWQQSQAEGEKPVPALHLAMDVVLAAQSEKLAIPHRYDAVMKEIWTMQPRFLQRAGQRPFRLLEHPRFRAAFDFLMMRCESGEVDAEVGRWWEDFQDAGDHKRGEMLIKDEAPAAKKRRRRKPRSEGLGALSATGDVSAAWVAAARDRAPYVPGVRRFDAAGALTARMRDAIAAVEGQTVLFVKGSPRLAAGQERNIGDLVDPLAGTRCPRRSHRSPPDGRPCRTHGRRGAGYVERSAQ